MEGEDAEITEMLVGALLCRNGTGERMKRTLSLERLLGETSPRGELENKFLPFCETPELGPNELITQMKNLSSSTAVSQPSSPVQLNLSSLLLRETSAPEQQRRTLLLAESLAFSSQMPETSEKKRTLLLASLLPLHHNSAAP